MNFLFSFFFFFFRSFSFRLKRLTRREHSFVAAIPRFKIESRSSTLLIQLIGKQLARLLLLIKNTVWRTRRERNKRRAHLLFIITIVRGLSVERRAQQPGLHVLILHRESSPLGETCALYYNLWTKRTMFRFISTLWPSVSTYSKQTCNYSSN